MRVLTNVFSWSRSRAGLFDWCLRAYWWQYYGAWGGWEANAPPEVRDAYVLKNLSGRWAWAGSAVHERIERILERLRDAASSGRLRFDAGAVADEEHEVDALTRRMRDQFRQSRDHLYRERPKRRFGLVEHEYGDPVSDDEWRAVNARACEALRGFLRSEVFARIRASDPGTWFPIETLDQFEFEGVGIWAVPDFARRTDGGVEIYDWKTGTVKPDEDRLQLAGYTLYMQARHGIDPARVTNHLVYLGTEVVVHDFVLSPEDLEAARATIRASVAAMRARLADVAANRADREDFPLTDDRSRCAACAYRRPCGR